MKMNKITLFSIIGGVLLLTVIALMFFFNSDKIETITIERGEIVKEVEINGKVIPAKEVSLGFETTGKVVAVYVEVGEKINAGNTIVELDTSELSASLRKAEVDLEIEKITLVDLINSGSTNEVAQAKQAGFDAVQKSFTVTDQTLRNKIDQLYDEPLSFFPKIIFAFDDYPLSEKLNSRRFAIGKTIENWGNRVRSLNATNFERTEFDEAKKVLNEMMFFLDDIAKAVNSFELVENMTQATVDSYKSDIGVARTDIQSEISNITTTDNTLRSVLLKVPTQEARVKSMQAIVDGYKAQIAKKRIVAPISGIITTQNAKRGETVQTGQEIVSIVTANDLQIEVFIPEISIANIVIGNNARVTLDAFGEKDVFQAKVISVEPSETIKDGISTYKTTLVFEEKDTLIKPGMTANVTIETIKEDNVIVIPRRSVFSKNDISYVQLKQSDGKFTEKEIVTGRVDSYGNIEIISGLEVGDIIVQDPTNNE